MTSNATAAVPAGLARGEREILDHLPGPVLLSIDGLMVYANPAALEVFGVDDLATLRAREATRQHVFPEDVPRIEARLAAVARGETVGRDVEYRILRPDGTVRVVQWTTLGISLGDRPALLYAVDDTTELAAARDALAASEAHQRDIVAALAEGVIVVSPDGTCTEVNPAAATLLHLPAQLIVGARIEVLRLIDDHGVALPRERHPVWRALDTGERVRSEIAVVQSGTSMRKLRISVLPIAPDAPRAGGSIGAVVTFDDVTRELEHTEQVARSEARFRNLAAISPVAIFETDAEGRCSYVNDRWCEFSGLDAQRSLGSGWRAALHPDDAEAFLATWAAAIASGQRLNAEFRLQRPDGSAVPVHTEAKAIRDASGTIVGWIGTSTDLTGEVALRNELRAEHQLLDQLAHRDQVTGLLNRRALMASLDARLRAGHETGVLFLDLDDFKAVNDTYGHDAGDELLRVFASRLLATVREHDVVARFAGDEFVVVAAPQHLASIAGRLLAQVGPPIALAGGGEVTVGVSIGIARLERAHRGCSADEVLQRADRAMYEAKRRGKGQVVADTA